MSIDKRSSTQGIKQCGKCGEWMRDELFDPHVAVCGGKVNVCSRCRTPQEGDVLVSPNVAIVCTECFKRHRVQCK